MATSLGRAGQARADDGTATARGMAGLGSVLLRTRPADALGLVVLPELAEPVTGAQPANATPDTTTQTANRRDRVVTPETYPLVPRPAHPVRKDRVLVSSWATH
jgi:hypothetical protein